MTTTDLQCYRVTGCVLAVLVMLMVIGCSNDKPKQKIDRQAVPPRQTIIVQIPASQWPSQRQPVTPSQVQHPWPAVSDRSNPWAVPTQPRSHEQHRSRQWGQPQPERPQYVQPSSGSRYRPLEPQATGRAPAVLDSRQTYRPVAPYDRLSGSSFGAPAYPYAGTYPGYYGAGVYAMPGPVYAPGWPGASPGAGPPGGWPGYW